MKNEEVIRRIKLIEKHLNGDVDLQFKNIEGEWVTLIANGNDYSIVMIRNVKIREKPQALEAWANMYSSFTTYYHSEQRALDCVGSSAIRIAVHMKEVVK